MNQFFAPISRSVVGMCACLVVATAFTTPSVSQEKKVTQTAEVDNTRMGAYRALAELTFRAFQKGDLAGAAELARVLERTWDAAEEGGGPNSLATRNKDLFEQVDEAMDTFIKPVIHYTTKAPDLAAVRAAYDDFLRKLKQGE